MVTGEVTGPVADPGKTIRGGGKCEIFSVRGRGGGGLNPLFWTAYNRGGGHGPSGHHPLRPPLGLLLIKVVFNQGSTVPFITG